jgi:hypothetical protein
MVSSQTCLPLCPTKQTGVVALIFTIGSFQSQRTVKTLFTNITAQRQGREDGSCDSRQDWLTMIVSERHCFTQIWRLLEQPSCPSCPSCPSWQSVVSVVSRLSCVNATAKPLSFFLAFILCFHNNPQTQFFTRLGSCHSSLPGNDGQFLSRRIDPSSSWF